MRTVIATAMVCVLALPAAQALAAPNISGNIIDFTNNTYFSGTVAGANPKITGTVAGKTFNVSSQGTLNFSETTISGSDCPGELACEQDGLGINDDEVSAGAEYVTVDFGGAKVPIGTVYLFDFFRANNSNFEVSGISIDGIMPPNIYTATAVKGTTGLFTIDFAGLPVMSLTFTAPTTDGNGVPIGGTFDDGSNDYAVAAISVVPLPLPLLMLLGALGSLGALGGRRRTMCPA